MTGIDLFTVEVLTWRGLVTNYVLFFVQLETRRVTLAGMTASVFEADGVTPVALLDPVAVPVPASLALCVLPMAAVLLVRVSRSRTK